MSKKKKRDRDSGAPEPGYALPTPPREKRPPERPPSKGMTVDAVHAPRGSLKETAEPFIDGTDPDADKVLKEDVEAIEAATAILSALQDEGIKDQEQVRDLIHDYNALAEQYRAMHQRYEEPEPIRRLGTACLCPDCKHTVRPDNPYCWYCGKRLGWGR